MGGENDSPGPREALEENSVLQAPSSSGDLLENLTEHWACCSLILDPFLVP